MTRLKVSILLVVLVSLGFSRIIGRPAPPEKTIENLMKQVRGDVIYWNKEGATPSWSEVHLYCDFARTAKRFAIWELGKRGAAAHDTLPELHELLIQHGDFLSGGLAPFRSDIARAMGMIDDPQSIDVLLNYLRTRVTKLDAPTNFPDKAFKVGEEFVWHLEDKYYVLRNDDAWGNGVGPEGIVDGLVLFGDKHHEKIRAELVQLQVELDSFDLPNAWTRRAITKGVREFFDASKKQQHEIRAEVIERGHLKRRQVKEHAAPFPRRERGPRAV